MIRAILAVYCFGPHATAGSIMFSAGLAAMYHVWGRYDDASQLRFGENILVWHLEGSRSQHWLDLYICKHKNRQDGGTQQAIAGRLTAPRERSKPCRRHATSSTAWESNTVSSFRGCYI